MFKSKRAKEFNYKPFYYDEAKEERSKRNRWIKAETQLESAGGDAFKSKLRERWESSNHARKKANSSNLRLIIIIIILFGMTYFLLK